MNLDNDMFKNKVLSEALKEKPEGDPLHKKLTELTGVSYERIREIEMDVLYMIKIDPEVKNSVILLERLSAKYKDGEMQVAMFSAGLVMGVDRGRNNGSTINRLHELLGGV